MGTLIDSLDDLFRILAIDHTHDGDGITQGSVKNPEVAGSKTVKRRPESFQNISVRSVKSLPDGSRKECCSFDPFLDDGGCGGDGAAARLEIPDDQAALVVAGREGEGSTEDE